MEKKMKEINKTVNKIIEDVKSKGDAAIRYYTKKFDNIELGSPSVTKLDIKSAYKQVDKETIKTLKFAKKNIEFFARQQLKQFRNFEVRNNGVRLGQRVIPIEKIGVYIPGGNYPLPSTALMCIIPAKLAGVKQIIACSPKIKAETIVAADIAGADKIFRIGGAQAIAAMAYGTKQIPKVDKIVGPGNIYVTAAKKAVYGDCGIDFLAGPSEIMIIADETGNAEYIAADLLAQAEHDINAKTYLVTTSKELARKVNAQIKIQLPRLKTKRIAGLSLKNGDILIVKNLNDAVKIANEKAPEHLEIQVKNPEAIVRKLKNYGSLFVGENTAEVFGDYCSGINHVLPTNGAARYAGGLSVKDFVKIVTYQKFDRKVPKDMIKAASKLADIEGLDAHRRAAVIRLKNTKIVQTSLTGK
ncbi:histidinol dehydrogenase [Candidatus Woesearchaeota archaeon]|nr:histidinol dehydrogenase [Candidatus Woesearchaeota archaeon]MBI2661077.1 histidinol dehydrogenase [Candidatus Woesearchaeota archaeon]